MFRRPTLRSAMPGRPRSGRVARSAAVAVALATGIVTGVTGVAGAATTPTPTPVTTLPTAPTSASPSTTTTPAPATTTPAPVTTSPAPSTTSPAPATTSPTPKPTTTSPTPKPTTSSPTPTPTPTTPPEPTTTLKASFRPSAGAVVGVAYLPRLTLNQSVRGNTARLTFERGVKVTSANPKVKLPSGSWAWLDSQTVVYRPKTWWPGHLRINVSLNLAGVKFGLVQNKRLVGAKSMTTTYSFRTGRALVGSVDANSHRLKVRIDGKLVKNFPVSLGKPDFATRSGIKVFYGAREATHTYTSEALGLTDETYVLEAPWNTRLTPSGEFIHAAPWAYSRIGIRNGSHGCTNMRVDDAKWVYDNVITGDPFVYSGTDKPMETTNGPFALWNIPWAQWRAKSAAA